MVQSALHAFSRAALVCPDDLVTYGSGELFVVTEPEGGLELHQTEPYGEIVIWAYSSFSSLAESCGSGQPYVRVSASQLRETANASARSVMVALDLWHPDGARYSEPDAREQELLARLPATPPDLSVLWVPTRPVTRGSQRVDAELHCITAGKPMLLAYTSPTVLREHCGPHQAAVAVRAERVGEVAVQAGAYGVVFDAVLAEDARHATPELDAAEEHRFGEGILWVGSAMNRER